jgi:hypothetical protein
MMVFSIWDGERNSKADPQKAMKTKDGKFYKTGVLVVLLVVEEQ